MWENGEPWFAAKSSTKFSTTYEVIIFVRDATWRHSVSHFPKSTPPFFRSRITQLCALTYGWGFSINSFCVSKWMSPEVGLGGSIISSCCLTRVFTQLLYFDVDDDVKFGANFDVTRCVALTRCCFCWETWRRSGLCVLKELICCTFRSSKIFIWDLPEDYTLNEVSLGDFGSIAKDLLMTLCE